MEDHVPRVMTIPPGSRLGPYELTAPIGAGSMGEGTPPFVSRAELEVEPAQLEGYKAAPRSTAPPPAPNLVVPMVGAFFIDFSNAVSVPALLDAALTPSGRLLTPT